MATPAVQAALEQIADNIEEFGHYRPHTEDELASDGSAKVCLVVNPTIRGLTSALPMVTSRYDVQMEMRRRIAKRKGYASPEAVSITTYSDSATTDEVLEMLRAEE